MTIATIDSAAAMLEKVLVGGDLSKLTPTERLTFYRQTCESLGLNPLTGPFAFIVLNNKLTLYAKRDCADQLRKLHNVSLECIREEITDDLYIVTMRATLPNGRSDVDKGAVSIAGLKGEAKANAILKSTTKAKRRVTLSICGLGMLDETEVETIPGAGPAGDGDEPDDAGAAATPAAPMSDAQRRAMYAAHKARGTPVTAEELKADLASFVGRHVAHSGEVTHEEAARYLDHLAPPTGQAEMPGTRAGGRP